MLVLSRKLGEAVVIPGLGVKVTVVEISGTKVRLGFDADREIEIFREELIEQDEELAEAPA